MGICTVRSYYIVEEIIKTGTANCEYGEHDKQGKKRGPWEISTPIYSRVGVSPELIHLIAIPIFAF